MNEKLENKDKFILTIKEASQYFIVCEKKLRRMREDHLGSFAVYEGNRYLVIRPTAGSIFSEWRNEAGRRITKRNAGKDDRRIDEEQPERKNNVTVSQIGS